MIVPTCRPYVPDLLLRPSAGLNIVRYNRLIDLTVRGKIMVPNTVLGTTVLINNPVLGSTSHTISIVLVVLKLIAQGPNIKEWGINSVIHSTGKCVGNV